ncbi:hypothetical protein EAG_01009 [Camponotus floridanus]|uniref:Uncharacterized protein n=1 Tax=Camponotus floridanus TaxID=104421 RepID=E2B114_CAMFO|nr:hypothetical protein EAG_01009 [Camponotus floridanus]
MEKECNWNEARKDEKDVTAGRNRVEGRRIGKEERCEKEAGEKEEEATREKEEGEERKTSEEEERERRGQTKGNRIVGKRKKEQRKERMEEKSEEESTEEEEKERIVEDGGGRRGRKKEENGKRKEERREEERRGGRRRQRKERRRVMEGIMEEELGREEKISEVVERKGTAGIVLIVRMEKSKNREELLERGGEISRNWGTGMDEDLAMEERKIRWRLVERAREERAKGNAVMGRRKEEGTEETDRRTGIDRKEAGEGRGQGKEEERRKEREEEGREAAGKRSRKQKREMEEGGKGEG